MRFTACELLLLHNNRSHGPTDSLVCDVISTHGHTYSNQPVINDSQSAFQAYSFHYYEVFPLLAGRRSPESSGNKWPSRT
jgi:hypothetical protein